jgi:acyl-CoA synthetase (AMP-forming)/AMP-acid ligase II
MTGHPKDHKSNRAVLVPTAGQAIDEDALPRLCADDIRRSEVLQHVVVTGSLPRTSSGKVKKSGPQVEYSSLGRGGRDGETKGTCTWIAG